MTQEELLAYVDAFAMIRFDAAEALKEVWPKAVLKAMQDKLEEMGDGQIDMLLRRK